ncbi:polysaccharide lyase 6 family protein [Catenovulum maritimum]|uniref:polysaccharide lyase 6 family protein n=1 Tax=Catenovulum maritimum TaxID=1513271 RepID=UPI00098EDD00|nr:polysaccharide lyase 6 family protein [Catenovulum maritimum]
MKLIIKNILACLVLVLTSLALIKNSVAAEYLVGSQQEYRQVTKKLKAGDVLVLKNGVWKDFEIVFKGKGTKANPITLTAETKGKVILSGLSNLRIAGEYLIVKGLVFKDGYTPTNEVISFKYNSKELAHNSRVTEVVIDEYSNPDRFESDYWVGMYGQNNRFDHSFLRGKRNKGVTMAVRLNTKESQENRHRIDHNYFGPRPIFGSNGGETLRIGTSHYSLSNSYTLVENNYFDRCDGEVEIISVKSGKNILRNNVFFESQGTLTLRHGNGNLVESNLFIGNGVNHTGGIRVINKDQIIRNNYLSGLTGSRFGSGFTIMNGVPNSKINRYHQVENALIENNTFIDIDNIHLAAGADSERTAAPINSVFKRNLLVNQSKQTPFSIFDDISGIKFSDNLANFNLSKINSGFVSKKAIELNKDANGLLVANSKNYGAQLDFVIDKAKTGPTWYDKSDLAKQFDSGKLVKVSPADSALSKAVSAASSGDIIELESGEYVVSKILMLNKVLTIKAADNANVVVYPERSTLFEIQNFGALKIDGLTISGLKAPDSSGNTLIRTQKWGMFYNYQLTVINSRVIDLDINHSYHFFDAGSRSFADHITIKNSVFKNITGDFLRLNKETDDLGIYNAEYVTLKDNEFDNIGGALLDLYRGGTDESTFGPHAYVKGNKIHNIGHSKRNKINAAIKLHGVQQSYVSGNQFTQSELIKVEHTVGDPVTEIENNQFTATAKPEAVELVFKQASTAKITNNTYQ